MENKNKLENENNRDNFLRELGEFTPHKSLNDFNNEDPFSVYIDVTENAIDSIETVIDFLEREDNLKWKWIVFALHHSLYCFCISALEKGNYEIVLHRGYQEDNKIFIRKGNDTKPKRSKIIPFFLGKYKTPAYRIEWDEAEKIPEKKLKPKSTSKLIGFWTALARVQDEYFWMGRLHGQKALTISDEELEKICWLIEKVRNDLTHFVPKGYSIDILSIIDACQVVLQKIEFLALDSYSINYLNYEQATKRVKDALKIINAKLDAERKNIEELIKQELKKKQDIEEKR